MLNDSVSVQTFGYLYYPDENRKSIGYRRLDVCLRTQPTGQHFDPIDLRFPAIIACEIQQIHLRHPWHGTNRNQVAAGRIIMTDWRGKAVEAFSFGGDLSIMVHEDHTLCILTSDAPILTLGSAHMGQLDENLAALLAERAEGVLAKARATYSQHFTSFDAQMAVVEPIVLYCAVITLLEAEINTVPHHHTQEMIHFKRIVQREHESLVATHRWSENAPMLALSLSPAKFFD
jgi:hypothetical protein